MRAGEPLMDGPVNPHDILKVKGEKELAAWLVDEIQQVYRLQGVTINDKHIEVIVRQMLRRIRIKETGDTRLLPDEQVEKASFEKENERGDRERRSAGGCRTSFARYYEGFIVDRVIHQRVVVSGNDESIDRGSH